MKRRTQAKPQERDYLARLVDAAYAERSPEQRDLIYQRMLRAPLEKVQELECLALERVLEEFREWSDVVREAEVLRLFEQRPDRPFAYSRFDSPLTSAVYFYFAIRLGEREDERLETFTVEATQDADPAEIAEQIRLSESAKTPDADEDKAPAQLLH